MFFFWAVLIGFFFIFYFFCLFFFPCFFLFKWSGLYFWLWLNFLWPCSFTLWICVLMYLTDKYLVHKFVICPFVTKTARCPFILVTLCLYVVACSYFWSENTARSTDILFTTARTTTQNLLRIPLKEKIDSNVKRQTLIQQCKMVNQERSYTFRI